MNLKTLAASAALLGAVGLAGCDLPHNNNNGGGGQLATASTGYCAAFKTSNGTAAPNSSLADPSAAVDDCLHRWAYVLSRGHDPADVVAHATLEACSTSLASWSQQVGGGSSQDEEDQSRYSRRGGRGQQAPNPMAQRMGMVNAKALFYVVQARAGNCALPPADSLVAPPAPG